MSSSKTSERIILPEVRLSFLKLDKPEAFSPGQALKYQATALLDPSDAEHAKVIAIVKKEAAALCQAAYGGIPDEIKKDQLDRLPYGLAANHPKKSKYDGYEGMFYIAASNTVKPGIANRLAQSVGPGEKQFPYSGCYGHMKISLWALLGPKRQQFGARIGANLVAVQFVRDGEAFGQAPVNVEDEFDRLDDNTPAMGGYSQGQDDPFG